MKHVSKGVEWILLSKGKELLLCRLLLLDGSTAVLVLLILKASRSHSDTPHSVGLLWTCDQPDAEATYLTTHNNHKKQTSMNPVEFEPAVPRRELQQTHPLDRVATGIGSIKISGNFFKTVI
jgi:hypothetical protein